MRGFFFPSNSLIRELQEGFQWWVRLGGQLGGVQGQGRDHTERVGAASDPSPAPRLRVSLAASPESLCLAHERG